MGKSRKSEVLQSLAGTTNVTEERFAALLEDFAISASTLRRYLRDSGISLAPLVEGVRQDSLEHLERTLTNLAELYPQRPKACRDAVLEAKSHAKFQKRAQVLLFLNTWLEKIGRAHV